MPWNLTKDNVKSANLRGLKKIVQLFDKGTNIEHKIIYSCMSLTPYA